MNTKKQWLKALLFLGLPLLFAACSSDDKPSTQNPAEDIVLSSKKHDTAILLCTFGSTFDETIETYNKVINDYKKAFPGTDVYLSFTSATCVNRVKAATGIDRYMADLWLQAIGKANYKRVVVQSLHVIPGEEYAVLMDKTVKKDFMISRFPEIEVLKAPNLLSEEADTKQVASILFNAYKNKLSNPKNLVVFMGHGNPVDRYAAANDKYIELEQALHELAAHKNMLVGTVDHGETLFFPEVEKNEPVPADEDVADSYLYKKLRNYCRTKGLQPSDITIYMAPVMSVAGDHAHNDLWGAEDKMEDLNKATPQSDFSWKMKLLKMGFRINEEESHHGSVEQCTIKGLGDYPEIRNIWVNRLKKLYSDEEAWENGKDYQ